MTCGLRRLESDFLGSLGRNLSQDWSASLGSLASSRLIMSSFWLARCQGGGYFDVVYGVDVTHAIVDDSAHFFEAFVASHAADCVALDENIALCE